MMKTVFVTNYKNRPEDKLPDALHAQALLAGAHEDTDSSEETIGGVLIAPERDGRFGVHVFEAFPAPRYVMIGGRNVLRYEKLVSSHRFKDFNRALKAAFKKAN